MRAKSLAFTRNLTLMEKETEEHKKKHKSDQNHGVDKLDAVRNLLFGEIDEEYRTEFEELKTSMEANFQRADSESAQLQKDIIKRLEQLEQRIESKLDDTVAGLNARLDTLAAGKVDRAQMSKILHELARALEG